MWRHAERRKNKPCWQPQKPHNQVKYHKKFFMFTYPYSHIHIFLICGFNGHKMTNCPKFVEMQKMFHGKFVVIAKVQSIVETQIVIADVNVVDVNVTTRSKVIKE